MCLPTDFWASGPPGAGVRAGLGAQRPSQSADTGAERRPKTVDSGVSLSYVMMCSSGNPMPPNLPLTLTLPEDVALALEARVAAGEYASEVDAIREGLLALEAREAGLEAWLRDVASVRFDGYVASPDQTLGAAEASARLRAHIARRGLASEP